MSNYLPIIISGIIIFTALMWWLLALGSVSKGSAAPKAIDAPPVAATPPPIAEKVAAKEKVAVAPLMSDPKPTSRTAPPKPQAPLKAAATKAAPVKVAKTATKKAAAPKAAAPKATAPKATAPKAITAKAAAPKPKAEAKAKIAASPKAAPKPKVAAKAKAAPKAAPKTVIPDNLELLKGVGPKLNTLLKSLGVTSFEQVANWSAPDITEIDAKLGTFAGRIGRDNWVDQAKLLVSGDIAGFEKKYGALGSEIQKG